MTTRQAHALLTFDDGKDKVFTTATYSFGYNTNVFTQPQGKGAVTQALSFGAEYTRRAGVISVDVSCDMNFGQFFGIAGQDYADPGWTVTLTKGTGRTTGSISISGQKQNVPDPVANNRAVSWDYSGTLNLRYPVNERLFLSDASGTSANYYTNKSLYSDLQGVNNTFNANLVYDSKLDLSGGYDWAYSDTHDTRAIDNGFSLGADGSLLPKLTGSLQVGEEWRQADYKREPSEDFQALTAAAALKWAFSRQLTFSGQLSKGFSISSTDISTDTLSAALTTDMAIGKRLRATLGLDYIPTTFLGRAGDGRKDYLWEVPLSLYTALTTHVRVSASYAYEVNYSNKSYAHFVAEVISFSITATY